MNYNEIKKLDQDTLEKLTDGIGPSDECLCSLLAPPDGGGGFGASLKKVFAWSGKKKARNAGRGQTEVDIPLTFNKGGKGIYTTKEVVKRASSCGKCGCDKENVVLKHSFANIRITSPDVSSICPCPTDCLPDREKLMNNIKVAIERLRIEPQLAISSDNKPAVKLPDDLNKLLDDVTQLIEDVSQVSDDVSQPTDNVSPVPEDGSQPTDNASQLTDNVSQLTYDVSQLTYDVSQGSDGMSMTMSAKGEDWMAE